MLPCQDMYTDTLIQAILNLFLSLSLLLYRIVRSIFFGELRIIEHERLVERSWFAVSEAIFAMSLFRNELSTSFVIHLTVIMVAKAFHWILHDRIDFVTTAVHDCFNVLIYISVRADVTASEDDTCTAYQHVMCNDLSGCSNASIHATDHDREGRYANILWCRIRDHACKYAYQHTQVRSTLL